MKIEKKQLQHNKLHKNTLLQTELTAKQKHHLAYTFCKASCQGRIQTIKELNQKRQLSKLKQNLKQMRLLQKQLRQNKSNRIKMMAIEGNIANYFFKSLSFLLPKKIGFKIRNPKEPDKMNALMNATHSILRKKIKSILIQQNINISIGYLHHQENKNKSFLVWDFAELWIPYTDKLCFHWLNKGTFNKNDFQNNGQGQKWLTETGWKKIYKEFYKKINPQEIENKVLAFKQYLLNNTKFNWVKK